MHFVRLIQYGTDENGRTPFIGLEQISAVWFAKDEIEVTVQTNDFATTTMMFTSKEFNDLIVDGFVHRPDTHSKGWSFWLGLHGKDACKQHIQSHNNAEWIEQFARQNGRLMA